MVNIFTLYDLTFFALFTLGIIIFLYTHKKNLKRQGILYLYRTRVGINFIEKFTKKFANILHPLQYVIILSGYILMGGMIWLLVKFSWLYLTSPVAAKALKVPVLIPLVPYLPDLFHLDFLPSFNFTYWIIIIAIIAIPHEFAHGIFARLNKIKVHSTGFGFLGPFLAAFVEPDEKQTGKASKIAQMSILGAGTFANVLTTILFVVIFWLFFISTFTPAGVIFNQFSSTPINVSQIDEVNGMKIDYIGQIPSYLNGSLAEIKIKDTKYYAIPDYLKLAVENEAIFIPAFDDSPAFNAKIIPGSAISEIDGVKITSYKELSDNLKRYSPGEKITIKTIYQKSVRENKMEEISYEVELDDKDGKAFLGIGISTAQPTGLLGFFYSVMGKIKDPNIFYNSSLGALGWFIYFFLWWAVIICLSVALVNMVPVGIFDGGRFFYLTVWGITGSKKIGKKAFELSTWFFIALIVALMLKWVSIFF